MKLIGFLLFLISHFACLAGNPCVNEFRSYKADTIYKYAEIPEGMELLSSKIANVKACYNNEGNRSEVILFSKKTQFGVLLRLGIGVQPIYLLVYKS
ncbi:MAG: hypothetical protein ACI857_002583 [Arenicella sp.]|jgi:hypothetical protein